MAWENRGNRRYYYRKRRDGGRVVSEYVGAGEWAELQAELDELERENQRRGKCTEQGKRNAEDGIERALNGLRESLRSLVRGHLYANGFLRHKGGEWRKHRRRLP